MTEFPNMTKLSPMQLDILELELRAWPEDGAKISEFRRMHPSVTETGYHSALLVLLGEPAAYEVCERRYAAMLSRLDARFQTKIRERYGLRGHVHQVPPL